MRIYPKRPKLWGTKAGEMGEPLNEPTEDMAVVAAAAEKPLVESRRQRKAIVSVHGRDIDASQLERDAA